MAEEQEEQEKQEELDEPKENPSDSGGGKVKYILIPVILVLQAAAAYFIVGHFLTEKPLETELPKQESELKAAGQFLEINDIVVNPAGTKGRRYLVFEMSLETTEPTLLVEAETKKIWIKDAILSFLTKKTSQELLDISMREALKIDLLRIVNARIDGGKFEKIYFTKYIMQ